MQRPETTPLVSVLIPLYNHAGYIIRCLDSILEDSYSNVEIIIIDDGSRDNSVALAQKWYSEQRTECINQFELISRPNKGLTRTLNELVTRAHGDYVILLASDDYLLPGGIRARLEYLLSHPLKQAVFGDCIVVDGDNTKTYNSGIADLYGGHIECLMNEELLATELIFNWCVPGPGFMAHKKLYDRIGVYDETLTVEDWDMYLRIAARGLLGFIPHHVAAYRFHGGNSVLNKHMKTAQVESLIQTAWKNHSAFLGIQQYGLLYKHYKFKKDLAVEQGRTMTGILCRVKYKPLYWLSIWRYKRVIRHLNNK